MRRDHRGCLTVDDEEYFENLLNLVEVWMMCYCREGGGGGGVELALYNLCPVA